jgi:hypothetical protein
MDHHEETELHKLSHEITRLITRVDYHEKEMLENKRVADNRFQKLEEKIDQLFDKFNEVSVEVKIVALKIAGGAVVLGIGSQLLFKHFGWL